RDLIVTGVQTCALPILGARELALTKKHDAGQAYHATFVQLILSRGLPHERRVSWDTTVASVDVLLESATHSSKFDWGSGALLDRSEERRVGRGGRRWSE